MTIRIALHNAAWYLVERSLLEEGATSAPVRIPTSWAVIDHARSLALVDTGIDEASCAADHELRLNAAAVAARACDTMAHCATWV